MYKGEPYFDVEALDKQIAHLKAVESGKSDIVKIKAYQRIIEQLGHVPGVYEVFLRDIADVRSVIANKSDRFIDVRTNTTRAIYSIYITGRVQILVC